MWEASLGELCSGQPDRNLKVGSRCLVKEAERVLGEGEAPGKGGEVCGRGEAAAGLPRGARGWPVHGAHAGG